MNLKHILLIGALCMSCLAQAQNNCNNPISLNSVLVLNTLCDVATGTIIITPSGGGGAYNFDWMPAVSNTNSASNLPAAAYFVHIERNNNPDCFLDTIIVVNNSNGPQVQANINPAQCQAANGSISLTPTNYFYNWSNGATAATITGLASQNYYVTVTNPGNGCYSVFKFFVPKNLNSLTVNALVQENAKCGMNKGRAQVIVAGGSGQYTYTPGPGPQYNNLPAGNYSVSVLDNVTNCTGSVNFTIENLEVEGNVSLTPYNARCAGQADGFVEFSVSAGQNFELPFVFTLKDGNGTSYSPGNLPAGNYILQIADADGCTLPPQAFSIGEPPAFNLQAQAEPETCDEGGRISLDISGGNGAPFIVNWADLPGDDNPEDRTNLRAGRYSGVVYDSLLCVYSIDTLLVAPNCNNSTLVHMVLKTSSTELFCVPKPPGLPPGATQYSLAGGGVAGSSAFGAWVLNGEGCLSYNAGANAGFAVDTICIVSAAATIGLMDTTCVVVSITQDQPTKTSVFFTVQVLASSTACGAIPPGFPNPTILQLGRPGLSGASDVYGDYQIDPATACATFFAGATPGFNVDEIRVAIFAGNPLKCHIISYFPTVLPETDCSTAFNLPDSVGIISTDCDAGGLYCVPIPFDDISNYTIIDNGALYSGGFAGCANNTTISYNVAALPPGGGPYQLSEWNVNGQNLSGNFLNINGLADLMNLLDAPPSGWAVQGAGFIRGGNLANTYGPLHIRSASGNTAVYSPAMITAPLGTELRFSEGLHVVVFRNVLTACSDTAIIDVECFDCAPIHSYPVNAQGEVRWKVANCAADTIFCTNIFNTDLGQFVITDNGQPFLNFGLCGNFVGMLLDTGLHVLAFSHPSTTCAWEVKCYVECTEILGMQTVPVTVPLGGTANICLDTSLIPPPVSSMINVCEDEGSTIIGYTFVPQSWCVLISGLNLGMDTICVQVCNDNSACVDVLMPVTVTNTPSDSLLAVRDEVFTIKDEPIEFPIIANDIVGGIPGNLGGLADVEFLSDPFLGNFLYNPLEGAVVYAPENGVCGVDSFRYRITDPSGQQSEATIKITIVCDKILVFNGISPNGDGRNDVWHIVGIEQFPQNEVQVFNRWGNQVYTRKGYTNNDPWNGQWNGKDLPDGPYYYIIDLGGNEERLSGWVEIMR
ncbi:MAG: gliding motility-associated C-terminal domain-containing protein [Saprospiraceae bacterium]|nr:gliding motility-associated C-terminal domain-containing protein [Saprospiraceae bacterium]